jgi:hypothetical protein
VKTRRGLDFHTRPHQKLRRGHDGQHPLQHQLTSKIYDLSISVGNIFLASFLDFLFSAATDSYCLEKIDPLKSWMVLTRQLLPHSNQLFPPTPHFNCAALRRTL